MPGETPEMAAARLGGTYVPPEEDEARLETGRKRGVREIASRALAATNGALLNGLPVLGAATDTAKDLGGPQALAVGAAASLLDPSVRDYLREKYLRHEAEWRGISTQSGAEHPGFYVAGAVVPALASGGGTMGSRLALSAGQGAASGALGSDSSVLTEPGEMAKDAVTGGAIGLAGGGVGEALGAGMRGIGNWAAATKAKMDAVKLAAIQKAVDDAVASLKGKFSAEVQKGSRLLENTGRSAGGQPLASGPTVVNPSLQARAFSMLSGPGAKDLNESVLANTLDAIPQQVADINGAKAAWRAAAVDAPKEVSRRYSEYLTTPLTAPLTTWARSQLPRQAAGALIGGTIYGAGELTDSNALRAAGGAAYGGVAGAPGAYRAMQSLLGSAPVVGALSRSAAASAGAIPKALTVANAAQGAGDNVDRNREAISNAIDWVRQKTGKTPASKSDLASSAFVLGQGGQ